MNNPIIEIDLAEILKDLQSGQREILKEISDIKVALERTNTEVAVLRANQENMKEQLSKIDGTQKAQIWALIVAVFGIVGVLAIAFFNMK